MVWAKAKSRALQQKRLLRGLASFFVRMQRSDRFFVKRAKNTSRELAKLGINDGKNAAHRLLSIIPSFCRVNAWVRKKLEVFSVELQRGHKAFCCLLFYFYIVFVCFHVFFICTFILKRALGTNKVCNYV